MCIIVSWTFFFSHESMWNNIECEVSFWINCKPNLWQWLHTKFSIYSNKQSRRIDVDLTRVCEKRSSGFACRAYLDGRFRAPSASSFSFPPPCVGLCMCNSTINHAHILPRNHSSTRERRVVKRFDCYRRQLRGNVMRRDKIIAITCSDFLGTSIGVGMCRGVI